VRSRKTSTRATDTTSQSLSATKQVPSRAVVVAQEFATYGLRLWRAAPRFFTDAAIQICRFHFYFNIDAELEASDNGRSFQLYRDPRHSSEHFTRFPRNTIGMAKASTIHRSKKRHRTICEACQTPSEEHQKCGCDAYDRFVGKRWLCLSCFIAEEAEALKMTTIQSRAN